MEKRAGRKEESSWLRGYGRGAGGEEKGNEESSWLRGHREKSGWRREGRGEEKIVDRILGEKGVKKIGERRRGVC